MLRGPDLTDACFDLPVALPFAPGASPFRLAGVAYRGVQSFVQSEVPGGMTALRRELGDPRIAEFVMQNFSSAQKYDVLPIAYVAEALARLRKVPLQRQLRESNRFSEARVGMLYRAVLGVLSAETIALSVPRAFSIAQDFGKATTRVVGPRRVEGVRSGVPEPIVRWLAWSNAAYLEAAMERSGAAAARVTFTQLEREPARHGLMHWSIHFDISWTVGGSGSWAIGNS